MLTWEKIPGSPRFSVLQATESWAGPGNEASPYLLFWVHQLMILQCFSWYEHLTVLRRPRLEPWLLDAFFFFPITCFCKATVFVLALSGMNTCIYNIYIFQCLSLLFCALQHLLAWPNQKRLHCFLILHVLIFINPLIYVTLFMPCSLNIFDNTLVVNE